LGWYLGSDSRSWDESVCYFEPALLVGARCLVVYVLGVSTCYDRGYGLLLNPSLLQSVKTAKPESGSEIVLITGRGWVVSCRQLMRNNTLGMCCGRCCSMGPSASLAMRKSWNEGSDDSGDNDKVSTKVGFE
jgi:hypothetical protein